MNLLIEHSNNKGIFPVIPYASQSSWDVYQEWQCSRLPSYRSYTTIWDDTYIKISPSPMLRRIILESLVNLPQSYHANGLSCLTEVRIHQDNTPALYETLHRDILFIAEVLEYIPSGLQQKLAIHLNQFTGQRKTWAEYTETILKNRTGIWGVSERNYFVTPQSVQNFTLYHEYIHPWFKKQTLLHSLEMDPQMKEEDTLALLERYEAFCVEHEFMNPIHLKFKKIGHTKKTGIWNSALNTIIVDPRHSESLWHELGHRLFQQGGPLKAFFERNLSSLTVPQDFLDKYPREKHEEEAFAMRFEMFMT